YFQMKTTFDVRLVKAWKGHAGIHGNKQRVEVFAVVIFVLKARDGFARRRNRRSERDAHGVRARLQRTSGKRDVAILKLQVSLALIDGNGGHRAFAKIQQHRDSSVQPELDLLMSRDDGSMGRKGEAQMVSDIRNLTRALPRQLTRDTLRRSST